MRGESPARVHLPPPRHRTPARFGRAVSGRSADAEQIDDEDQGLAALDDAAGAALAVAEVRRDGDLAAAAELHAGHALVPARDDLTGAQAEPEGVAAVPGGIELLARG